MLGASRDYDQLRISLPSHPRPTTFSFSPSQHSSPSHISANRQFFQHLPHATSTPSPSDAATSKTNYFDRSTSLSSSTPAVVYDTSEVPINSIDLYMSPSYDFPSNQQNNFAMPLTESHPSIHWSQMGGNNMGAAANSMGLASRTAQNHQRMLSSSSIGSNNSTSPFQGQRPRVTDQSSQKQRPIGQRHARNQSSSSRSHLPTPLQTPTRNVFLSPSNSSFAQQDTSSMTQVLEHGEEELPQMSRSARPSFSSVGQGPATPMTTMVEQPEEQSRALSNDMMGAGLPGVPKLERTVTDAYNDTLWFPQMAASSQAPSNANFLMPTGANTIIHDRLLEAQMARTSSTGSNQSGALSPYQKQRLRSQDTSGDSQYQLSPQTESETKTISPKEALLDYNPEEDKSPLFPNSQAGYAQHFNAVAPPVNRQPQMMQQNSMGFGNMLSSQQQSWVQGLPQATMAGTQSYNSFATPQIPNGVNGVMNLSGLPQWPSSQQSQRSLSRQPTEPMPEFPAQLTSMESSASEAAPPSSQASSGIVISPKPNSAADSGTYSCTFSGCFQRFPTPQKLQRHKRDHHRANPNVTPGVGSGMSTEELLERNSQTGPHKCQRTNPTTGKPCDQIFSRPYDLTRHEDTIHNIRKQKVRCAICIEEKTFSRSDALTRHMRVVHPEIEFPGKHRKRGSREE